MAEGIKSCSLAQYIRDDLFAAFKENRRPLEQKWQRNLDAYKSESRNFWQPYWKKGEAGSEPEDEWRSNTFVPMTRAKVNAAHSLIIDMELQGGKFPFDLKSAPWQQALYEEMQEEMQDATDDQIEDMKRLIEQQIVDCRGDRELTKCSLSGCVYGDMFAKRYVHTVERKRWVKQNLAMPGTPDAEQYTRFVQQVERIVSPAFEYKPVWNCFPDLEVQDYRDGCGFIERDFVSPYDLRLMQNTDDQYVVKRGIQKAIRDADKTGDGHPGSDRENITPALRDMPKRKRTIERLEFWGRVPRKVVEEFEDELQRGEQAKPVGNATDNTQNDGDEVYIMAQVAGEHVVRYSRIEGPDDIPYYHAVFEPSLDDIGGRGVPDAAEQIQNVLNGMVRAFEDNKKLSANVMLALKKRLMDWDEIIKPGATIELNDEADSARDAVEQIIVQDVGATLTDGIRMFERYFDIATNIPQITQGIQPEKHADTAYELSQLLQNAGKYLGGVIRNIDDGLIEPIVTGFYEYNMRDPSVTRGKGDYIVKPLGFTSYQARVVKLQTLQRLLALIASSEILAREAKIGKHLEEIYKAEDVDPDVMLKSSEEKAQEAEQAKAAEQEALQMQIAAKQTDAAIDAEAKIAVEDAKHENDMEMADMQAQKDAYMRGTDIAAGGGGAG